MMVVVAIIMIVVITRGVMIKEKIKIEKKSLHSNE